MRNLDICVMDQVAVFSHPELVWLYQFEEEIPTMLVERILMLPRTTLLEDLEHILNGAIDYYECMELEEERTSETTFLLNNGFQVIHALYLLTELEAHESLPTVIRFLEQVPLLKGICSDCITQYNWIYFHHIFIHHKPTLEQIICSKNYDESTRIAVASGISAWYILHPEFKAESELFWKRVMDTLRGQTDLNNYADLEVLSFVVCNIIDSKLTQLLPTLSALHQEGYLLENVLGSWESIEKDLTDGKSPVPELPIKNIFEIYEDIKSQNDFDLSSFPKNIIPPITRSEPKLGRNDPCPCGSGKKYKKCCSIE